MNSEPCNCASGSPSNKAADIFAAIAARQRKELEAHCLRHPTNFDHVVYQRAITERRANEELAVMRRVAEKNRSCLAALRDDPRAG